MRTIQPDVLLRANAELGEGPTWEEHSRELVWVDIPRGRIHFTTTSGADRHLDVGQPVGAVVHRASHGLAVAIRDGFAMMMGGGIEAMIPVETELPANRMNDGKVDPLGNFWAGTMGPAADGGSLYRLDADRKVTRVLDGIGVSNGLGWSPDGTLMYYADTLTGRVDVMDFNLVTGDATNRRPFVEVGGSPDGLAVDTDGATWVAIWDGGEVRRYLPSGHLEAVIKMPVGRPTSCAFGGVGLDELYITSAAGGPTRAGSTEFEGSLFVCRPGATGAIPFRYAG